MATPLLDSGSIRLRHDFLPDSTVLYEHLAPSITWDTRLRARQSASFGLPYNYSGIVWPAVPLPDAIARLLPLVAPAAGFTPNNCLANYYLDGASTMGYHFNSTAELEPGTGIAVLSLGAQRTMTFRRTADKTVTESYPLSPGSLLWMSLEMQSEWMHAILAEPSPRGRISLTFRRMSVGAAGAE